MSLTSGTNKWASRAVVALQLAAWSAVGIVLLEKGVASLQRRPHSFHLSHERIGNTESSGKTIFDKDSEKPTIIRNLSPDEVKPGTGSFSVLPLALDEDRTVSSVEEDGYRKGRVEVPTETSSSTAPSTAGTDNETRTIDYKHPLVDESNRSVVRSNNEFMLKNGDKSIDRDSETVRVSPTMPTMPTMKAAMVNSKESTMAETEEEEEEEDDEEEEESRWKSRKRSRFAKVGAGGGAAAAAAMVAVGAIMLILGPAVIVLRALDERRRKRRFLKLSGEEDLPPSYEEATGNGDRAPTYSSLNLDTILTSLPSSPSPSFHDSTCLRDSLDESTAFPVIPS